jgi:hypothetical protein
MSWSRSEAMFCGADDNGAGKDGVIERCCPEALESALISWDSQENDDFD